jgi:hypothetical protein
MNINTSCSLKSLLLIITNFRIHDLTEQQTTSLKVILTGCCDVLGTLEQELLQYEYFDTPSESVRDKLHKAISKPKWNQTRIERFRTQIGTKVDLLNAFTLSHIR